MIKVIWLLVTGVVFGTLAWIYFVGITPPTTTVERVITVTPPQAQ